MFFQKNIAALHFHLSQKSFLVNKLKFAKMLQSNFHASINLRKLIIRSEDWMFQLGTGERGGNKTNPKTPRSEIQSKVGTTEKNR